MISIVMMSYLGEYPGSRSNPIPKFNRAVQSVVDQSVDHWELIIVSDGCELTNQEYSKNWSNDPRIRLIKTEKSKSKWPGSKRQIGVDRAKHDWILYLDSDDIFTKDRIKDALSAINNSKSNVIFDDVMSIAFDKTELKDHTLKPNLKYTTYGSVVDPKDSKPVLQLGTNIYEYSSIRTKNQSVSGVFRIIHKRDINTKWEDLNKTGEDNLFIRNLMANESFETTPISGYIITHMSLPGFDI